jgi:hypothetical protein
MRIICEALAVSKLKDTLKRQLGRDAVSPDMRNFAYAFPVLQDVRHLADYDPTALFQQSDVASLIDATEVAMADFDRATDGQGEGLTGSPAGTPIERAAEPDHAASIFLGRPPSEGDIRVPARHIQAARDVDPAQLLRSCRDPVRGRRTATGFMSARMFPPKRPGR